MITVHVVDDHPVVRQGVGFLLDGDPAIVLAGSSSSAPEAIARVAREHPDVVLLDVRLGEANVVATVRSLRQVSPTSRIVLFTADPAHPLISAACAAGAVAVVGKDISPTSLRGILRDAAQGLLLDPPTPRANVLTGRQQQVLELIATGMTNSEVATHLGIRPETVKDYWKLTLQRLGARNRAEAITVAHQRGLL